jgi:hypothetical protein
MLYPVASDIMETWQRVVLLCALLTCVVAEKCERKENKEGCTVEDGHAHCEAWNITASIEGLPACITRITFSLLANPGHTWLCLEDVANFSHLLYLEELTLHTKRQSFSHLRLIADNETCYRTLQTLPLRAIRFQMQTNEMNDRRGNAGMYKHFKLLDILDITRGQRCGIPAFMHVLGPEPSMKELTLKNVQQYKTDRCTPTLELSYFLCGGNVQQLDLSYNDIVTLNVSTSCWSANLQYLNLDHNLLAKVIPERYFWINAFSMLAELQVLRASASGSNYQSGMCDEPMEMNLVHFKHKT